MQQKTELTIQQSAELLNVSEQFMIHLLETGEIPFYKVGSHRRVRLDDVMAYKKIRQGSQDTLDELTKISQDNRLYDL